MPRSYHTEIIHEIVSDIVANHCQLPLLTAEWVTNQALQRLKENQERAALREGVEAIARDVLMNSNPARYRVSRHAEFQFVMVDHLTDGEMIDLLARIRMESLACAEAALDLQHRISMRMRKTAPEPEPEDDLLLH